jgi:putative ABC transport system permease protein
MMLWALVPRLVWRFRRLLFTVMVAAALLGAASSVAPLFLESSERQALEQEFERRSRFGLGLQIVYTPSISRDVPAPTEELHRLGTEFRSELQRRLHDAGVGRPIVTFLGSESVARAGREEVSVRLIHRTGALNNVTELGQVDGPGLWISDVTARDLSVETGDSLTLSGDGGKTRTTVAGIYRFLPRDRPRGFWTPLSDFIDRGVSALTYPPSFAIASRSEHRGLVAELKDPGQLRWEVPLTSPVPSLDHAKSISRTFREESARALTDSSILGRSFRRSEVGLPPQSSSLLPGSIAAVEERVDAITPAVDLLAWTARVIALGTLTTVGVYLVGRRRTEITILLARGVSPLAQVMRMVCETLAPLVVGAAIGALTALFVISWIGSSLPLPSLGAIWPGVGLDLLLGWGLVAASLAFAIHSRERAMGTASVAGGSRRGRLLAALAGSLIAGAGLWLQTRTSGERAILDPISVAAPVAVMIGAALTGAVAIVVVLARVATRSRRPAVVLGLGRLAGAASTTLLLIAACAASLGVLVYGLAVSASIHATVLAKARVFVGSDVAASVGRTTTPARPPELPLPSTEVVKVPGLFIQPADTEVEVMAVDVATFAKAAYWDDSFSEHPLTQLLSMLDETSSTGTRAITVGVRGNDSSSLGSSNLSAPLDVVASVKAWPGMSGNLPLVVVERDSLDPLLASIGGTLLGPDQQIWARGSSSAFERALTQKGIVPLSLLESEVALETPILQAMRWTLGVLIGLGVAAGCLCVTALMLNLESRHRATMLAAVLTRRMGLEGRRELWVWIIEITTTAAVSYAIALLVALPLADFMSARMDLRPAIPPEPIFALPTGPLLAAGVALIAISSTLAFRLQRRVDRVHVPELLRSS